MSTTTDLVLLALLLALVAIFFSSFGLASEGGIYILLALAVGIIAGGASVLGAIRER